MNNINNLTAKDIKLYLTDALAGASSATIDRKMSSLKKFFSWAVDKGYVDSSPLTPIKVTKKEPIEEKPAEEQVGETEKKSIELELTKDSILSSITAKYADNKLVYNALNKLFFSRPKWYKQYHSLPGIKYFHTFLVITFSVIVALTLYVSHFQQRPEPQVLSQEHQGLYIPFKGNILASSLEKLDNLEVSFLLFDKKSPEESVFPLWTSGTCFVKSDEQGNIELYLGSKTGNNYSCPSAEKIPGSIIDQNSSIWLEIVVNNERLSPRTQIATVNYALNAQTLDGHPVEASGSAVKNSVLVMNDKGQVVIGETNPTIKSSSGNMLIEGEVLTFKTPDTSDGSIYFNPDGSGSLNITLEGVSPAEGTGGFVNAVNANIASGALFFGETANNLDSYDLIKLKSGSTPEDKFWVNALGKAYISGGLGVGTIDPTQQLHIAGNMRLTGILFDSNNESGIEGQILARSANGVDWVDPGNLTPSDVRIKENIQDSQGGWDTLKKLRVVDFNYTGEFAANQKSLQGTFQGLIAQDLEQIVPQAVTTRSDGLKSINYDHLVPLIIKGVQELGAKVEETQSRIEEKQEENSALAEIEELLRVTEENKKLLEQTLDWKQELTSNNLYVTNMAAINSLSVTSSFSIGSDLFISSSVIEEKTLNSINTFNHPLRLQSLAMAPLEVMGGKFTVDQEGNVTILGSLSVSETISASSLSADVISASSSANFAETKTGKLIIAGSKIEPQTATDIGRINTNSSAGQAVLSAGETVVTIDNNKVTNKTLVYITPNSPTNNNILYVKSKDEGYFKVAITSPITKDISFNWWIIDTEN